MKDTTYRLKGRLPPLVAGTVILAMLPVVGVPRGWLLYLVLFFIYLPMANMWNLLAGYSGLISLCQPAFIGLAGYTLVIVTWVDLPFYLGIIGGAVVAAGNDRRQQNEREDGHRQSEAGFLPQTSREADLETPASSHRFAGRCWC